MSPRTISIVLLKTVLAVIAISSVSSCSGQVSTDRPANSAAPASAATPKTITPAELSDIKWIEGAWKGTGDVEKPFFELYRFENESTLAVDSFDDESLGKVTETSRFALKDGQFASTGEGSRWAAADVTKDSITFAPIAKARNTFTWRKKSDDAWEAVLEWPPAEGKPATRRVYQMTRIPLPKK